MCSCYVDLMLKVWFIIK